MEKDTTHLQTNTWKYVNRQLIKKAISEFLHELLLKPTLISTENEWGVYTIAADNTNIVYEFKAKKFMLDHWYIDAESITKQNKEKLDVLQFIVEFQKTLEIPNEFLPTYLEEITSTLSGAAYKYETAKYDSATLVANANFQHIEHALTEGHPCFVANNGRIGFNIDDYFKYAPEADNPFKIIWLAGVKKYTTFTAVATYEYESLIKNELGKEKQSLFIEILENKNLNPSEYIFIPVHPWQWKNKLVHVFAADIANNNLVFLGEGTDEFSAQQSIRTLFNKTNPKKLYTKTALSILNMGFVRGLSPYYMQSTPHITKWITDLLKDDLYLQQNGFTMLGEVATVGYHNHYYEVLGKTNPHNKMLSALWRESPFTKITTNQNVMAMAALLHIDKNGVSLLAEQIKASSYTIEQWMKKYLQAYLSPLLHCFYTYEFVFMPHGENIIMVMENHAPAYVLMKDITEEVIVFNDTMYLPEHADRLYAKTSDKMKVLAIFTDIFDSIFRFIAQILETHVNYSETLFWQQVADCIYEYQESHPELSEKYDRYDLFIDEFDRCCLNRLQLKNTKQMLDLADPIESLKLVGTLKNPLALYRKQQRNIHNSITQTIG